MDTTNDLIAKAIEDIKLAEEYSKQAAAAYYRAKKTLESLHSPASPKRGKKTLSDEMLADLIFKRNKKIKRQKPK